MPNSPSVWHAHVSNVSSHGFSLHAGVINREEMSSHMFEVTVQCEMDILCPMQSASAMLHIMVLDENDNTPTFLDSSYFSFMVTEDTEVRDRCG